MRRCMVVFAVIFVTVGSLLTVSSPAQEKDKGKDNGSRLVYADFEQVKDGHAVSARGGTLVMSGFEAIHTVSYTNSDKPWPRPPFVVPAAQNHSQMVGFDFSIPAGNAWASVNIEIRGLPEQDGKQVGEDVSMYNFLVVQVFAKGTDTMRAEVASKDNGVKVKDGEGHSFQFKLSGGFNTYRLPLNKFTQPKWDNVIRVDLKDVLKHLTSVSFAVMQIPSTGQVVIDNVAFEK